VTLTEPARVEEAAGLLKALADPTRLAMLVALREAGQPVCVCDFTAAFGLTQPTISHHMARLREAGLVEARKEGIWTYYSLREPLPPLADALLGALPARSRGRA
jgi:ArsR family transcriptional regulator, arsenate/arsenite/antimonite-responsive transcriptional repressor